MANANDPGRLAVVGGGDQAANLSATHVEGRDQAVTVSF
jgi:hypothetical protein